MSEPQRDIFGRTEAEIVAAIAQQERVYDISKTYTGGEGLSINLRIKQGRLEVDRRCLARIRGQKVEEFPQLNATARAKLHREILSLGRHWAEP